MVLSFDKGYSRIFRKPAMSSLIHTHPQPSSHVALPTPIRDAADTFARAEKAPGTIRAYSSDARFFDAWCRKHRIVPSMPAGPEVVAGFLGDQAEQGIKASTISRRVAAIGYAHKLAGLPDPILSETVRRVVRGIRRKIGSAKKHKAPATVEILAAMLSHAPATMARKRDRALLALGFSGAFRRSELVALDVADLADDRDGLRVTIRKSKTDQEGRAPRSPSLTAVT